jgi:hypothetical protein
MRFHFAKTDAVLHAAGERHVRTREIRDAQR